MKFCEGKIRILWSNLEKRIVNCKRISNFVFLFFHKREIEILGDSIINVVNIVRSILKGEKKK